MEKIVVLVDNISKFPLKHEWGFSALIKISNNNRDTSLLMDVGPSYKTLLHNANYLNLDLKKVETVVISHMHYDHTGALADLIKWSGNIKRVILPYGEFSHRRVSETVKILSYEHLTQIDENLYVSGTFGSWTREQALIVETKCGLFLITGCSHPGVIKIAKSVYEKTKKPIKCVIGGFHRSSYKEGVEIAKNLQQIGATYVIPCHCTGESAKKGIYDNIDVAIWCSVGLTINCADDGKISFSIYKQETSSKF